jgi:hypothetical protein
MSQKPVTSLQNSFQVAFPRASDDPAYIAHLARQAKANVIETTTAHRAIEDNTRKAASIAPQNTISFMTLRPTSSSSQKSSTPLASMVNDLPLNMITNFAAKKSAAAWPSMAMMALSGAVSIVDAVKQDRQKPFSQGSSFSSSRPQQRRDLAASAAITESSLEGVTRLKLEQSQSSRWLQNSAETLAHIRRLHFVGLEPTVKTVDYALARNITIRPEHRRIFALAA